MTGHDAGAGPAAPRPSPEPGPVRKRERPDPRPTRLMIGAGAVAALTVIGAGMVRFPVAATEAPSAQTVDGAATKSAKAQRPVRYIKLKRGQQAPKGAKVIQKAAPKPRVVIRRVTMSAPTRATSTRSTSTRPTRTKSQPPVARTRQSG